jgi:ribosomal protein L14E/L6E/L27E
MLMQLGSIVQSKAGRDQGKIFIVVEVVNSDFVRIADGDLRKIEDPKLKKIKHLQLIQKEIPQITQVFINLERLTNTAVRNLLEQYKGK